MNKLSLDKRTAAISALAEGCSPSCAKALRVPSIVVDLEVVAFSEVFHVASGAGDELLAGILVDEASAQMLIRPHRKALRSDARLDGVAASTVEHSLFQKNVVLDFQLRRSWRAPFLNGL